MYKKAGILQFILFIFTAVHLAGNTPKYSNEFLSVGIGARSLGMAKSTTASVRDVTSVYWNPAGMVNIERDADIGVMHSEYFAGLSKFDFLGGVLKTDSNSAAGFSVIRFGVDEIQNTLNLVDDNGVIDYNRIKEFSVADWAFTFSYAKRSKVKGLQYGANAKVIHRLIGEFASAWGFGIDVGIQYFKGQWAVGLMGRDITTTFNAWNFNEEKLKPAFEMTGNEMPENALEITMPKITAGIARTIDISKRFSALVEADIDMYFDGKRHMLIKTDAASMDPHIGFEIGYKNYLFFRGGVGSFQEIQTHNRTHYAFEPNMGLGIKVQRLHINYALTNIGSQSVGLYSNIFSLHYAFDFKK